MHGFDAAPDAPETTSSSGPWWKELNRYHWFVLIVAALGWLFDTMDQQLFNLARVPAMRELLAPSPGVSASAGDVDFYGGIATAIFLLGWASGGLGFGIMGDRIGRAKTMLLTILLYSAFTGLSALSWDFWSFAFFRFLTGLGVGGEFAVGVALVAEVMPLKARPFALGLLQALSAVGNISAAIISLLLADLEEHGVSAWRVMFVIGAGPALLAILIRRRLKEPEQWQAASTEQIQKQFGSYGELFGNPRWRKNAIVGLIMAASGVIGLWGIGFFSFDLSRSVFRKTFEIELRKDNQAEKDREFVRYVANNPEIVKQKLDDPIEAKKLPQPNQLLGLVPGNKDAEFLYSNLLTQIKAGTPKNGEELLSSIEQPAEDRTRRLEYLTQGDSSAPASTLDEHATRITTRAKKLNKQLTFWAAMTSIMQNLGSFFGIYAFTYVTHYVGRRAAFAVTFLLAMLSTIMVFGYLTEFSQIFWMIPIMGFCQLALFGGYAIYFPELFPTHLRSTGTSFCYNVGRFVAACGPLTLGTLSKYVFSSYAEPMRPAAVTMSVIFLIGLLALPFAPETKGKPLPE
ncbi:MFS transporter [Schlesneria paludicola]|uniref:MFS transporter n=1 Tax=Schlesneria paludicola TaxID=360056 RepID=UPI00029A552B|nr:MFS transporter [Schlesneria paludicola]